MLEKPDWSTHFSLLSLIISYEEKRVVNMASGSICIFMCVCVYVCMYVCVRARVCVCFVDALENFSLSNFELM
jgi:hypothetical protein